MKQTQQKNQQNTLLKQQKSGLSAKITPNPKISKTRRYMEALLNGRVPLERSVRKPGKTRYYFLKPRTGENDESLSDMDTIDVPDGVNPYLFGGNGYQMPAGGNKTFETASLDENVQNRAGQTLFSNSCRAMDGSAPFQQKMTFLTDVGAEFERGFLSPVCCADSLADYRPAGLSNSIKGVSGVKRDVWIPSTASMSGEVPIRADVWEWLCAFRNRTTRKLNWDAFL